MLYNQCTGLGVRRRDRAPPRAKLARDFPRKRL